MGRALRPNMNSLGGDAIVANAAISLLAALNRCIRLGIEIGRRGSGAYSTLLASPRVSSSAGPSEHRPARWRQHRDARILAKHTNDLRAEGGVGHHQPGTVFCSLGGSQRPNRPRQLVVPLTRCRRLGATHRRRDVDPVVGAVPGSARQHVVGFGWVWGVRGVRGVGGVEVCVKTVRVVIVS